MKKNANIEQNVYAEVNLPPLNWIKQFVKVEKTNDEKRGVCIMSITDTDESDTIITSII
jgi:hypothetical protein